MWSMAFRPTGWNVRGTVAFRVERLIARGEDALVAVAVDEAVRRVAIGADGGVFVDAVLVLQRARRRDADRRRAGSARLEGRADVVHFEGDVLHAVAVLNEPLAYSGCSGRSGEASTKVMSPCRRT